MEQLFNIDLKKISSASSQEALERKKNLELFLKLAYQIKKMKIGNFLT